MISRKRRALTVAAVVTVAVTGAAGYMVAQKAPTTTQSFCADMPDAIGLYAGNAVTQMGYKVGTVDHIEPDGDHVTVTFSLQSDRAFPVDVKAITRSKSLLADRSLELVGNYRTGPTLAAGVCIPAERTFTPKSISEIAGSASDFISAMAPTDGSLGIERSIQGMDEALRGNGEDARSMLQHAADAMTSPENLIADVGSTIHNMAPLTDEALTRWSTLRSLLDQLPSVVAAGTDLFPSVVNLTVGVAWLVRVLNDIQPNYGDLIWPLMNGGVADVIHLAATRSEDIASLIGTIPSVAELMQQQAAGPAGSTSAYQPPNVLVDALQPDGAGQ